MPKRPNLAEAMQRVAGLPPPPAAPAPVSSAPAPAEEAAERPARQPGEGRGYYAATRAGRKKVTAALEPEAHRQLKFLSAERGQPVEVLLREAINDLFRKYDKPPIA